MKKSISREFFFSLVIIVVITTTGFGFLSINNLYKRYQQELAKMQDDLIKDEKAHIENEVNKVIFFIENLRHFYEDFEYNNANTISLQDFQEGTLQKLAELHFANAGFFFGSTSEGDLLFWDGAVLESGESIRDLAEFEEISTYRAFTTAVENPEGNFIYHFSTELNGTEPGTKLFFVKNVPEWEWVIGAVIQIDEMGKAVKMHNEKLYGELRKNIYQFIFAVGLMMLIFLIIAKIISRRIRKSFGKFRRLFAEPEKYGRKIDPAALPFEEFEQLAESANLMLKDQHQNNLILAEKEAQLRKIIDTIPHLIFVKDHQYRYILANKAVAELYETTMENVVGKTDSELAHSTSDAEKFKLDDQKIINGEVEKLESEETITRQNGMIKYLFTIKVPFQVKKNDPVSVLGVCLDISDLKSAQAALEKKNEDLIREINSRITAENSLEETQEQLKHIIDNSSNIFFTHDATNQILFISQQVEQILGYTIKEALVKWTELTTDHPDNKKALEITKRAIATIEAPKPYELELRHKDGSSIWVEVREAPILLEDSVVIVGSYTNITEQKRSRKELQDYREHLEKMVEKRTLELETKTRNYEESQLALAYLLEDVNETRIELEQLNRQYAVVNEELRAFSYSVSHDLKAPLRAIAGFAKIIETEYTDVLDAEARECITIILKNASMMNDLIQDLLQYSQLSRKEIKKNRLDMRELAREVYENIKDINPQQQVEFQLGNLPLATGDRTMIKQVFANLISNAFKYSANRDVSIIEVGHINENERPVYYVKDNGVGFNIKYADKLFGVFQRLHSSEEFEGTGVGLAIVKRILTKHGGKIWAEAEPDNGATFFFKL